MIGGSQKKLIVHGIIEAEIELKGNRVLVQEKKYRR